MKIIILAKRDLASNLALNQLLPRLAGEHELRVFLSSQVGSTSVLPDSLRLLKFFEQTLFNDILFPAMDGGAPGTGYRSFNQLSQFTVSPVTLLNRINTEQGLATLNACEPDLVICIRYGAILKEQAIAIPRLGVINLHSGILPDYRGVMATFRALMNSEEEIGATLHYISDASIDTGDIIATTRMGVVASHSYLWHVLQLYPAACKRLLHTIEQLSAGQTPNCRPQSPGGHYYSFPTQSVLDDFSRCGRKLFDVDEISEITAQYCGPGTI